MKRKILCLILAVMLLPFVSVFGACGKKEEKGYDLTSLKNDFVQIVEENNNLKIIDGELVFDFSKQTNLKNAIENHQPYNQLNDYNKMFSNLTVSTQERNITLLTTVRIESYDFFQ